MAAKLAKESMVKTLSIANQPHLAHLKCTKPPELIRQFIHSSLYDQKEGYFQKNVNIFQLDGDKHGFVNFRGLKDHNEYNQVIRELYVKQSEQMASNQLWHTPSELFRPWYAQAIAKQILSCHRRQDSDGKLYYNSPMIIYEVGPGNGSLCADILAFFQEKHPDVYKDLEYHLVEISELLIQRKLRALQAKHVPGKIHIHQGSFIDLCQDNTGGRGRQKTRFSDERSVFVLAMELFDNLPQDRIRFRADDGSLEEAIIITNTQTTPFTSRQEMYTQAFRPATDPQIIKLVNEMDSVNYNWPSLKRPLWAPFLDYWPLNCFEWRAVWEQEFIPTGPVAFINALETAFPKRTFIMSDFDMLPDPMDAGHWSPRVQTRTKNALTVDCDSFLVEKGLVDIFFPINFQLLSAIISKRAGNHNSVRIMKHAEFCRKWADCAQTRTRSGYNPMIEDFENVSFLISDPLTKKGKNYE